MSNTKRRPPENKDCCPFGFDQIFFLNSKYSSEYLTPLDLKRCPARGLPQGDGWQTQAGPSGFGESCGTLPGGFLQ